MTSGEFTLMALNLMIKNYFSHMTRVLKKKSRFYFCLIERGKAKRNHPYKYIRKKMKPLRTINV